MKLTKVRITNFQSILDSNDFEIGDVTCLVGKNESGKTALLKALYRLNPINEEDGRFDVTDDYPRGTLNDYEEEIDTGNQEPAEVVYATYALEDEDLDAVKGVFGPECFKDEEPAVTLKKGYSNTLTVSDLNVDPETALKSLVEDAGLPAPIVTKLLELQTVEEKIESLASGEQTEASQKLSPILQSIFDHGVPYTVFDQILRDRIPKFLYFDEYYQLKGQENLDALRGRLANNTLEDSDHPLLGIIDAARLNLEQITNPGRTEVLISRLEAAGNSLTQSILTYWSQNKHLRMKFDIRPALPQDPPDMTSGTNIWGRVEDIRHYVSTSLGTRSRGFVWFFSFLAWYQKLRRGGENLILLLDEPGLSLHAKAQGDLLRYFEEELVPCHQLIYTTHSPFMVDPMHFERVRIVQDLSLESRSDDLSDGKQGTKVITEVLEATSDSLFPLQGALGYEIYQTLFIGPNSLVVEGVSDLLYIQTMSALLQRRGREGLRTEWTITPVGSSDKVTTFVALIGANTSLNIAVLIDYQKKDQQKIENLYKKKLLKKKQVLTYADFIGNDEADVEDMFTPEFYLELVNGEFETSLSMNDLSTGSPRILRRLENHFENNALPNAANFNHYRPALYFSNNLGSLEANLTDLELDRFQNAFDVLNKLLVS